MLSMLSIQAWPFGYRRYKKELTNLTVATVDDRSVRIQTFKLLLAMKYRLFVATVIIVSVGSWCQSARAQFFAELFAPVNHTHFSPLGTPYVHPFNFEPPQIHQDAFFIYKYTKNTFEGSNEHEAEAHLDWALTERLGYVIGVPLVGNEDRVTGAQNVGFGDLEFIPRIMWINHDRFVLSSNFSMTFPTGDTSRDLGAGETVLSPYITTWNDLGNWTTLFINFGPNFGTRSGDATFSYAFSLTHSFLGPSWLTCGKEEEEEHEGEEIHFPPGMITIYLEMTGETDLTTGGEPTFIEIMPGLSYILTEHAELRFGTLLPISRAQRFDAQFYGSFSWLY